MEGSRSAEPKPRPHEIPSRNIYMHFCSKASKLNPPNGQLGWRRRLLIQDNRAATMCFPPADIKFINLITHPYMAAHMALVAPHNGSHLQPLLAARTPRWEALTLETPSKPERNLWGDERFTVHLRQPPPPSPPYTSECQTSFRTCTATQRRGKKSLQWVGAMGGPLHSLYIILVLHSWVKSLLLLPIQASLLLREWETGCVYGPCWWFNRVHDPGEIWSLESMWAIWEKI